MINFDLLFEMGTQAGLIDMEVYLVKNDNFSCKVFEGAVDAYSVSKTQGLSFRGIYNGKMGYTYTEKCDDSSIPSLITHVIKNALLIEKVENEELYGGDEHYVSLNLYDESFNEVTALDKINFLKEVEKECFALDPRVKSVDYCSFANGTTTVALKNTKGLNLSECQNFAYSYVSVLVSENGENKNDGHFIISTDFSQYEPHSFAKKIVSAALSQLGAQKVKSGVYPIVLKNLVAGDILEAMSGIFSADAVLKDLSRLKDKVGVKIAAPCVTIIDDPHLENGMASSSFDGEGVSTFAKEVITAGVLNTYLHSLTTAKTFNVKPTGNASRASFKSSVNISPSNMYIRPQQTSFDEILKQAGNGIYITDVQGLHAGLNAISGDFSLSASGLLIENGKLGTPVHELTIAGNFFELLHRIIGVGNDLDFGPSNIGSPTLLIESLTVAGE
ncbi:MAG: TldD/PmbA family protein [Turicibacter sp.]|nr:TldD/PmbA family protein [Turicibacter sp.]